ncbi:xanthine dehydrogenase accessory protein XdhC [Mesorhizobium sp. LHD-90]|uniref:xanthine dehydrogenase accessory protein XdhC n=1 Tax=Mesorhizobium sp. LHD-90 TaxID=3071414 RepID=UPI0027E185CB|nr:xanthine dehydrogenase accessory protein XdhC [Mesorhizobium sp. LHD-90]MDQ6437326.1 xanthine dehydrogenase accessory protein XdhC [Mesorhizobium sp. LHD-90]
MASIVKELCAFLDGPPTALVEVVSAKGSTPREKGAWMLVSPLRIFGTIGGGQLEFMAIDKAREMLRSPSLLWGRSASGLSAAKFESRGGGPPEKATPTPDLRSDPPHKGEGERLSIPLGPEIGQCCGGRVELSIRLVDAALEARLLKAAAAEEARLPHVYVFGGGHVGHALASAFSLLPLKTIVVETRADALEGMPASVETRLTPVPEEMVRDAPAGSAFVVLTHDHALDFLIVAESLRRDDAAYVGMIGSKTKKATFRNWYLKTAGGSERSFSRLVSPIGGDAVKDKRPAVIAALAAAEIMTALATATARGHVMQQA